MRGCTTILQSQCEALRNLPPEQFKNAVLAIWDYELYGKDTTDDPVAVMALGMVKPMIDIRVKKAEAGSKGGSASGSTREANLKQNEAEPKQSEANPKQTELKDKSKKIKEVNNNKDILSGKPDPAYQYEEIIEYLNQKAGTSFRSRSTDSRKHIHARLDEGFTLQDFKTVIDKKVAEWKGTDMAKYLRPATLFGSKFEGYLNQQAGSSVRKNAFNNFQSSGTDWDAVADLIMEEDRNG